MTDASSRTQQQEQEYITERQLLFPPPPYLKPKQAWVESLDTVEHNFVGLIDLHPDIFDIYPR